MFILYLYDSHDLTPPPKEIAFNTRLQLPLSHSVTQPLVKATLGISQAFNKTDFQ